MSPGHGEIGQQDGSQDSADARRDEGDGGNGAGDEGEEYGVDEVDAETPETCWVTALGLQVSQRPAERGRDGLLLGSDGLSCTIGVERRIGIGIDGGKRLEEGIGRLDHHQSRHDATEGVVDLVERRQSVWQNRREQSLPLTIVITNRKPMPVVTSITITQVGSSTTTGAGLPPSPPLPSSRGWLRYAATPRPRRCPETNHDQSR